MADVDVTSTSTATVDVIGLDDIKADVKVELPQPFKTEGTNAVDLKADLKANVDSNSNSNSTTHLSIDPLKTDSSLAVDLKPAVVDLCLTLNVGKVPSLCIRQPYRHRIGFMLYGVEVFGFSFSGEQETIISELGPRPQTLPRAETPWPPERVHHAHEHGGHHEHREPRAASGAGLRIRLEP
jgi:hypothetical protein